MEYKTLLMEIADGVAKITLNRPKAGNALSCRMICCRQCCSAIATLMFGLLCLPVQAKSFLPVATCVS